MTAATSLDGRIDGLTAVQRVAVARKLVDRMLADPNVAAQMMETVDPRVASTEAYSTVREEAAADPAAEIDPADADKVASLFLHAVAQDEGTAAALRAELDAFKDEAQLVEVILALGAAVSMVLITSTIGFKFGSKGWEVSKRTAGRREIAAATGILKVLERKS